MGLFPSLPWILIHVFTIANQALVARPWQDSSALVFLNLPPIQPLLLAKPSIHSAIAPTKACKTPWPSRDKTKPSSCRLHHSSQAHRGLQGFFCGPAAGGTRRASSRFGCASALQMCSVASSVTDWSVCLLFALFGAVKRHQKSKAHFQHGHRKRTQSSEHAASTG